MGADVEGRSRAEERGRRGGRTGSIFFGVVVVVRAVDVVLARTRDGREWVWRESTILCVFVVSLGVRWWAFEEDRGGATRSVGVFHICTRYTLNSSLSLHGSVWRFNRTVRLLKTIGLLLYPIQVSHLVASCRHRPK